MSSGVDTVANGKSQMLVFSPSAILATPGCTGIGVMDEGQFDLTTINSEVESSIQSFLCSCGERLSLNEQFNGQPASKCLKCLIVAGYSPFYPGVGRRLKFDCQ